MGNLGKSVSRFPDKIVSRFPSRIAELNLFPTPTTPLSRSATRFQDKIVSRFLGRGVILFLVNNATLSTGNSAQLKTGVLPNMLQNRNVTRCPDNRPNTDLSRNVALSTRGPASRSQGRSVIMSRDIFIK